MWLAFFGMIKRDKSNLCRPFIDYEGKLSKVTTLQLLSDASRSHQLGMGAVFLEEDRWIIGQWNAGFVQKEEPSIEFLELYAMTAAVLTWGWSDHLHNQRITVYCDNESVVHMINNSVSSCSQCRKLIRILTLENIKCNRRLFARHIRTHLNVLSDALSRQNLTKFWKFAPKSMRKTMDQMPDWFWPPENIWFDDNLDFLSL